MATYVLIHPEPVTRVGAGLWSRELRTRGHEVVVMDLPVDDDAAALSNYMRTSATGHTCIGHVRAASTERQGSGCDFPPPQPKRGALAGACH